ncbi:tyrosine-tRNA ligase [Wallemia mellicola CBS 633.66]|uniref:Tyrosine--tRNA ligase n=1 Tax=Wallemia mellicola (strain ATCC MYA-4683 / CBS 633.66) TaxID=671144 RepID=I4Y9C5_WALMC|nr:tyrosine-tRNA ligase [Wallemia mellicola CBS 633.66]EIM20567.1 tyrosine-tRNA ligase [Wallemia mellicola CBS 633.66]|eukprot:XP_006959359.1 tyrosine-tRNA ligase [Wallemia mellicola CBS 633.66]
MWAFRPTRRLLKNRSVYKELVDRGFVKDTTSELLGKHLESQSRTIYSGMDPTAVSLHAGHLLPLLACLHLHLAGHRIIPLIGGATGSIGDPSGRSTERTLIETKTLDNNIFNLTKQIESFYENSRKYADKYAPYDTTKGEVKVLNNKSWLGKLSLLEFLSTTGKISNIGPMLARDSVKNRLAKGISFTEFTYQLLQAADFQHLFSEHDCTVQIGGSDQWGNITAGVELIRRVFSSESTQDKAFGLTLPLLTTSSGDKFGKSAGNAVWLNSSLTSVFDFYQFWLKVTDMDVEKYLKLLTLVPLETISQIMEQQRAKPDQRLAQRRLADEVTTMIHGETGLEIAHVATNVLFGTSLRTLKAEKVVAAFESDPRLVRKSRKEVIDERLTKVVTFSPQVKSGSQAKTLIGSGGVYLNGEKTTTINRTIVEEDIIDNELIFIRTGKSSHLIIQLVD